MWLVAGALLGGVFSATMHLSYFRARKIAGCGLLVAALNYIFFAVDAKAGSHWLMIETIGVLVYGIAVVLGIRFSLLWLAIGWALHPVWDLAIHYWGSGAAFAPAWYTLSCLTFDLVVAAYLFGIFFLNRGSTDR